MKLGAARYLLLFIFAVIRGAEIRCQLCPVVQYDEEAVVYTLDCGWSRKRISFQCRDGYSYQSGSYQSECSFSWPWWRWTGTSMKCISTKTSTTTTTTTTISLTDVTIPTGRPTTMDLSVPQTVQYPSSTVRSSTNDFKTTSTRTCSGEILLSKMDTLNAVPLLKFDPNATFKTDDRVLYECANGYRFMNGPLEHVCGNDGAWKGALPYCKRCRCPCSRMKNQVIIKTQEELQNKINVMTEKLKVKKSDLTSVKSRKTSAPDPRPSSKAVGSLIGIGILVFIFAVIIISDFPLLYTHIKYGPYHGR